MNHFDDDRRRDVRLRDPSGGAPRQRHQHRANLFSLIGQRVLRVGGDIPFERLNLLRKAPRHGVEKRFGGSNDFLPCEKGLVHLSLGVSRARLGNQHAGQFTVEAKASQTVILFCS